MPSNIVIPTETIGTYLALVGIQLQTLRLLSIHLIIVDYFTFGLVIKMAVEKQHNLKYVNLGKSTVKTL